MARKTGRDSRLVYAVLGSILGLLMVGIGILAVQTINLSYQESRLKSQLELLRDSVQKYAQDLEQLRTESSLLVKSQQQAVEILSEVQSLRQDLQSQLSRIEEALDNLKLSSQVGMHPSAQGSAHAEHVFIIAVDGLRPDALLEADAPHLGRLMREGAFTLKAQTIQPSVTLPAHASLVSGVAPDVHKVMWNGYEPERGFIPVPTIFDLARQAGLTTAMFAGKTRFRHLARPGTLDWFSAETRNDLEVMQEALRYIAKNRPQLVLIHLPNVDKAGHQFGWMSPEQLQAVSEVDRLMAQLLQVLDELGGTSTVIVTADHGGHERVHGTDDPHDMTIPWIIWGSRIVPQELPPVQITDTAATALWILGVNVPMDWQGQPIAQAFSAGTPSSR